VSAVGTVDLLLEFETRSSGAVMDLNAELQALSRKFAADLASVVKIAALEAVAEALQAMTPSRSSTDEPDVADEVDEAPRPGPPQSPAPAVATSAAELDRVLFLIKAKPGQRFQQIRDALGINPVDLRNALDLLLALGKIVENGRGGGMTYRAG
jgi:hypothetical protein